MKEKLINKLIKYCCPNDFGLDIKCIHKCPVEQMEKCWNNTFDKYDIKISEDSSEFKHRFFGYSFEFNEIMSQY